VVDLDEESAYSSYLRPTGTRIPLYPLLAVIYGFAPSDVYPVRDSVSIIEFAADFGFDPSEVSVLFETDPAEPSNARLLEMSGIVASVLPSQAPEAETFDWLAGGGTIPTVGDAVFLNDGLVAEVAIAADLTARGWTVVYTGNQSLLGYDLRAQRGRETIVIEVKSSVGYVTPKLTSSEWAAANAFGDTFILALVDFVGTERQAIRYVSGAASRVEPAVISTLSYRLSRAELDSLPDAGLD
jgi:hypothetical protein